MKLKIFRNTVIDFLSIYDSLNIKDEENMLNLLLDTSEDFEESDIFSPTNHELIKDFYRQSYQGVSNYFLQKKILLLTNKDIDIVGNEEILETCYCCGYRTIKERGTYEICEVCKWEDVGIIGNNTYSSPNKMTLLEAKEKFSKQVDSGEIDNLLLLKYNK